MEEFNRRIQDYVQEKSEVIKEADFRLFFDKFNIWTPESMLEYRKWMTKELEKLPPEINQLIEAKIDKLALSSLKKR